MRVLHFYKTSVPETMGGIEQVIDQIARGSSRLGVNTEVLSLTSSQLAQTIKFRGYTLHRAKLDFQIASTSFSWSVFSRFLELSKKADVIHYHFPWPFMDLVHFASNIKKPTIVTYHSDIIRQQQLLKIYRPLKHKFLGSVDRIIATSPNYFATSKVLEKFADKVSVIPIGLDKDTYPRVKLDKLNEWRKKIGDNFFLFVGVIRYYKGLHILLEAASGTNFPVVIVGSGPIEKELKAQAIKLRLDNIYFLGALPDEDKVILLTLCLCVVFPSHLRSEAFGISLLEGAMYGKPLISSEIGTGTTFININKVTGLVVQPGDPLELRQAMRYMWEHRSTALEMGESAFERYCQYFKADKMTASYINLYENLTNKSN